MIVVSFPTIDELEGRMRPGAWSVKGFLGPHERLEDVLAADASTLAELGLNGSELAEPLQLLIAAHFLFLLDGLPLHIPPLLEEVVARHEASRAEIECRFGRIDSTWFQVGERHEIDVNQFLGTSHVPGVSTTCKKRPRAVREKADHANGGYATSSQATRCAGLT
jgi:hypothetical protein